MLFEISSELIRHRLLHKAPYVSRTELGFCLTLVLRVRYLYRNNGCYALADVVAGEFLALLQNVEFFTRVVYDLGERGFKTV